MHYFKYLRSITAISLLTLLATGCADATGGAEPSSETDRDRQIEKPNFAQGKADGVTYDQTHLGFNETRGNYLDDRLYAGYTFRADRGDELKFALEKEDSFTVAWLYGPFENGSPNFDSPLAWQFSESGKVVLDSSTVGNRSRSNRYQPDTEASPLRIPERGRYLVVVGPRKQAADEQHYTVSLSCYSDNCAVPFRLESKCSKKTYDILNDMSDANIGFEQTVVSGEIAEDEFTLLGGRLSDHRQASVQKALKRFAANRRDALRRYTRQTLDGSVRRYGQKGVLVSIKTTGYRKRTITYLYDSEGNLRLRRKEKAEKLCNGILEAEGTFATSCSASNVGAQILSQYADASPDHRQEWQLISTNPKKEKFFTLSPKVRRVISEYTNDEGRIEALAGFSMRQLPLRIYSSREGTVVQANHPGAHGVGAATYVFGPGDDPLLALDGSKDQACEN